MGFLDPVADNTDGGWSAAGTGGSPDVLYTAIDEDAPYDTDYIYSSGTPSNDTCKIKLSAPAYKAGTPFIVLYRYGKSGPQQIDITVRLLQGTTQISSYPHTNVSTTPVTVAQTLSAAEFASITDFTDLYLEFKANKP